MNTSASRKIESLTQNVNTFPREVSVWNKLMSECIKLKVQMTKCQLTSLLFNKLKQKNIGTPAIEKYVRNEARTDRLRNRNRKMLLKLKLENAHYEETKARNRFSAKLDYLRRRWGRYHYIMNEFYGIMETEVTRIWSAGRSKINPSLVGIFRSFRHK